MKTHGGRKASARRAGPAAGAGGGGKPPSGKKRTKARDERGNIIAGRVHREQSEGDEDEDEALGALIYKYSRTGRARAKKANDEKRKRRAARGEEPRCPDRNVRPARKRKRREGQFKSNDGQWNERLEQLKAYNKEHGHCNVPKDHVLDDGIKLGGWVITQRQSRKKGILSDDRKQLLEQIGFKWSSKTDLDEHWNERFERLKVYKKEHGHCNIPRAYEVNGIKLGGWVNNQRTRKGKFSDERMHLLEDIGFQWRIGHGKKDKHYKQWNERFEQLKAYKKEHGDCNVPMAYSKNGIKLGGWGDKSQRLLHKRGMMSEKRVKLLEDVGFRFVVGTGHGANNAKGHPK